MTNAVFGRLVNASSVCNVPRIKSFALLPAVRHGASIGVAAAALILAGTAVTPATSAEGDKGRCIGANACKGQSAC
jgi:hypothetical protein